MNGRTVPHRPISNQLLFLISIVALRPGGGHAAFFVDVRLGDLLTIPDWPVWNGKNGDLQPAAPTKLGKDGDRFPIVKDVKPELLQEIFRLIREACKQAHNV